MTDEEKKAIEYYQDKEVSFEFECDLTTEQFLKALGIEEKEEDSFENHQIRFKTLLNIIEKLQKENEELKSKHYFINGLRCGKSLLKQNVERAAEFERLKKENEYLKLHYQKSIIEQKNMIPKQKIKEKIEELNKQYDFYNSDRRETKNIAKGYYIAIQKLQELLESEE